MDSGLLGGILSLVAGVVLTVLAIVIMIRNRGSGVVPGVRRTYWGVMLFLGISGIIGGITTLIVT